MFINNNNEINGQDWLKQALAYGYALAGLAHFNPRSNQRAEDLACFGRQCVAVKKL